MSSTIIKLKDTDVVKVSTFKLLETVSRIEITFSNGDVFSAESTITDFSDFANEFYGNEYPSLDEYEFCDMFVEELNVMRDAEPCSENTYYVHARISCNYPIKHNYQYKVERYECLGNVHLIYSREFV